MGNQQWEVDSKMTVCAMCGGSGKTEGVWYGQKTGKIVKCWLCLGTGKSDAQDIFKM